MQIHFAACCQLCLFQTSLSWFTSTSMHTQAPNLYSVTVGYFQSHLIKAISRRESRNRISTFWAQNHNRPFPLTFCIVGRGVGNRRGCQTLQGCVGLRCANPDALLGDGTALPHSSSLACSRAARLTCSEPCKDTWCMLIPKQSWAAAHSHPHPGCSSLLSELLMPASGKFVMGKTTGSKIFTSRIFLIIFWIFTLSLLQFQSRSTKKAVWGSTYLYFRSTYCPGI